MSSPLNAKKAAIIIGGISAAVVCASTIFHWYRKRRFSIDRKSPVSSSTKQQALTKARSSKSRVTENQEANELVQEQYTSDSIESSSSSEEIEMATTVVFAGPESARGGRRDYRHRRNVDETYATKTNGYHAENDDRKGTSKPAFPSSSPRQTPPSSSNIYNDPAIVEASAPVSVISHQPVSNGWVAQQTENALRNGYHPESSHAEIRGAQLAAEFSAKCQLAATNCEDYCNDGQQAAFENGVRDAASPLSSIKGQCVESPSLTSDLQSEASQDSGKGTLTGITSSMSPVEEFIEIPAVYEFEVPQDIVGLLIGKQGITIKWLTQESQAHIVIRQHFYSDRHKICTLEGTREQINKCLRLIRRKFPPSRFPDLKLTPIIPPPASAPQTPVWDNVIQLNLPEAVSCEVVVSSVVNAGHVFLQQPTHPTFPSLIRLDQYMGAVYGQALGVPPLPRPVETGVICAAPVLGGWYRAQTIDAFDDTDETLVKFVDYGGYSRIPTADLRQIRSDFMTLPFQASECYLAHIKPISEDGWSPDASALFEQLSQGKVLEASIVGHATDNIPLIELYLPSSDGKNIMINRVLAEKGHAVWSE